MADTVRIIEFDYEMKTTTVTEENIVVALTSEPIPIPATTSGATGTFTVGETVTQAISGATAKVVSDDGAGAMTLSDIIGTFDQTNIVTGGTSGFECTFGAIVIPLPITGIVAEVEAWDGIIHKFSWTCTSNGELVTGTELDPTKSFSMKFSTNILDVLNDKTKLDDHAFGAVL